MSTLSILTWNILAPSLQNQNYNVSWDDRREKIVSYINNFVFRKTSRERTDLLLSFDLIVFNEIDDIYKIDKYNFKDQTAFVFKRELDYWESFFSSQYNIIHATKPYGIGNGNIKHGPMILLNRQRFQIYFIDTIHLDVNRDQNQIAVFIRARLDNRLNLIICALHLASGVKQDIAETRQLQIDKVLEELQKYDDGFEKIIIGDFNDPKIVNLKNKFNEYRFYNFCQKEKCNIEQRIDSGDKITSASFEPDKYKYYSPCFTTIADNNSVRSANAKDIKSPIDHIFINSRAFTFRGCLLYKTQSEGDEFAQLNLSDHFPFSTIFNF